MRRTLIGRWLRGHPAGPSGERADAQCRDRRRPEHGRLHQGLSWADVREEPSWREGRRCRHRPRRRRIAEDLREARRAEEGRRAASDFDVVVIHQKAAGTMVKDELLEKYRDTLPTGKLVTRDTANNSLGADVSRLRHADVPLADGDRLQPRPGEGRAEHLRRTERVGEEEPEAVRL